MRLRSSHFFSAIACANWAETVSGDSGILCHTPVLLITKAVSGSDSEIQILSQLAMVQSAFLNNTVCPFGECIGNTVFQERNNILRCCAAFFQLQANDRFPAYV